MATNVRNNNNSGPSTPNDNAKSQMDGFSRYDTTLHGLGARFQRLATHAGVAGVPSQTVPFHQVEDDYLEDNIGVMGCCPPGNQTKYPPGQSWQWTKDGKLKITCPRPIVPVPVVQEVHRRDKIIEIPQVDVVDAVKPKVYNQGVKHDVPRVKIEAAEEEIEIPNIKYVEKEVIVPIVTGYTHKFVPKWEIREVPRPVVKYVGEQEIIEVDVPEVKFINKVKQKEVVVDTVEKRVQKIIEVPKYVETVKYMWKPVEKIVHIERFVPKFDVSLECPSPLIVPYPVQSVKEMASVMVRKNSAPLEFHEVEIESPEGTIRVPDEYIEEHSKTQRVSKNCCIPNVCHCDGGDEIVDNSGVPWRVIQKPNDSVSLSDDNDQDYDNISMGVDPENFN